jgi:hypothetical protein
MKAAHRPHILVSELALIAGQDHESLCKATVSKAYWVSTDGDLRMAKDWTSALQGCCNKCREEFASKKIPLRSKVYFAVDGQLAEMYQKSEVPEIQRLID